MQESTERKSTGQRLVLSKRSALPVTVVQDNWKREKKNTNLKNAKKELHYDAIVLRRQRKIVNSLPTDVHNLD